MKIRYYLLFIILFLISFNVYATQDFDSQFNITIPDYDLILEQYNCGSENVRDFLHNFISQSNHGTFGNRAKYTIFVDLDNNVIRFIATQSSYTRRAFAVYGSDVFKIKSTYSFYSVGNEHSVEFDINYTTCNSNISTSGAYSDFLLYLNDPYSYYSNSHGLTTSFYELPYSPPSYTFSPGSGYLSIDTGRDYDIYNAVWYYWTNLGNHNLEFKAYNSDSLNSSLNVFKKLYITNNHTLYSYEDDLPSYYDIKRYNDSIKQFDIQLNTIYSKIPYSDINDFSINLSFKPSFISSQLYNANMYNFNEFVYGRVNHNNDYYTYESLNCSLSNIDSSIDSDNYIHYLFEDIVCDNSVVLSNYDYFYITLVPNYNNWNIDQQKDIFGINLNSKEAYVTYLPFKNLIYEPLFNLSSGFELFFTTTNDNSYSTNIDLYSSQSTTAYSAYDINDFTKKNLSNGFIIKDTSDYDTFPTFATLYLNSKTFLTENYGYMIYDTETNNPNITTDLYLFIDDSIVISNKNSNDIFYYYDLNTSSISSTSIVVNHDVYKGSNELSYDIRNFTSIITSYLQSLSVDILEFSSVLSDFYISLPVIVQVFLYVLFNIICIRILLSLLKSDKE